MAAFSRNTLSRYTTGIPSPPSRRAGTIIARPRWKDRRKRGTGKTKAARQTPDGFG